MVTSLGLSGFLGLFMKFYRKTVIDSHTRYIRLTILGILYKAINIPLVFVLHRKTLFLRYFVLKSTERA